MQNIRCSVMVPDGWYCMINDIKATTIDEVIKEARERYYADDNPFYDPSDYDKMRICITYELDGSIVGEEVPFHESKQL